MLKIMIVSLTVEMNISLQASIVRVQSLSINTGIINIECVSNCRVCNNANTCQTCKSGFGLQNNICATCPSGKYLSGQNCVSIKLFFSYSEFIRLSNKLCDLFKWNSVSNMSSWLWLARRSMSSLSCWKISFWTNMSKYCL